MNRTPIFDERTAVDRLEQAECEAQQARAYLQERDQISKTDPNDENLRQSREAFLHLKECEELLWWMQNEISNQKRRR
jgi:hypothetical protein